VERWLLDVNQQVAFLDNTIKQQSIVAAANPLRLEGKVLPGQEYALQLLAVRSGETSESSQSFLTKTCQITKLSSRKTAQSSTNDVTNQTATVKCGNVEEPIQQPIR
jgi:hypothetical protein